VVLGGELLGYVVFGQIRNSDDMPGKLKNRFPPAERKELLESFLDLPQFSAASMDNLAGLMKLLVDYIVRSELVVPGGDSLYRAVVRYIEENLTRNLTLPEAARQLGRSVSSLSHFLQQKGTTFKKLLIEKRLAEAEKLLKEHPEMTIKEAADRSGFSDAYYFSRIYRKFRRRTPGEFRKGSLNSFPEHDAFFSQKHPGENSAHDS
ncbi:MAG: helix-turn-helix domain-containing protein, partial [Lentisphaeria bacterium]|nr:helix-turn-helix domain-containing protein [Lentisphaeria bacterium]